MTEKASERASEKTVGSAGEKSTEKASDKATEKASDEATEKASDKAKGNESKKTTEKTGSVDEPEKIYQKIERLTLANPDNSAELVGPSEDKNYLPMDKWISKYVVSLFYWGINCSAFSV